MISEQIWSCGASSWHWYLEHRAETKVAGKGICGWGSKKGQRILEPKKEFRSGSKTTVRSPPRGMKRLCSSNKVWINNKVEKIMISEDFHFPNTFFFFFNLIAFIMFYDHENIEAGFLISHDWQHTIKRFYKRASGGPASWCIPRYFLDEVNVTRAG